MNAPAPERDFASRVRGLLASKLPAPSPVAGLTARLFAALAVRGRTDPQELLPAGLDEATRAAAIAAVAPDVVTAPDDPGRWWLRDDARRRVLTTSSPKVLEEALGASVGGDADPVLHVLRARRAPLGDISGWSAEQLRALAASEAWLDPMDGNAGPSPGFWHGDPVPGTTRERVAALLVRRQREKDLERMGRLPLYGRKVLLDQLLGIVWHPTEPGVAGRWVYVSGVGGSGKSTLFAQLEAALAEAVDRQVTVHLDCDEPGFDPCDPVTLDVALLRQVGIALPDAAPRLSALALKLADMAAVAEALPAPRGAGGTPELALERIVLSEAVVDQQLVGRESLLRDALRDLLGGRRLVLLVDTAELVFPRGQDALAEFAAWIGSVVALMGAPDLRLVAAGRDPLDAPGPHALGDLLGGSAAQGTAARFVAHPPIALADFPPDDAESFLRDAGLPARAAKAVAHALPGSPLLLRIAAELHAAGGEQRKALLAQTRRGTIPEAVAQRYLLERVLRHVSLPEGRPYVAAALALPEVTHDLLERVVLPAVDGTSTGRGAAAVFEALRAAGWLVRESGDGRRLWFHTEIRRLALRLLESTPKDAGLLRRVRGLARDRFAGATDVAARTLHAYFDVLLDGSGAVRHRAGLDPSVLGAAVDDLPEAARERLFGSARVASVQGGSYVATEHDEEWRARLEGTGDGDGEGARLVKRARAAEALALYRPRPTRPTGLPPTFVVQALADDAQWDTGEVDVAAMVEELRGDFRPASRQVPNAMRSRLYWLTRYALLASPGRLSDDHRRLLRDVASRISPRGPVLLFPAILAVADALDPEGGRLLPPSWLRARGAIEGETRMFLVAHLHRAFAWSGQPHADRIWVMRRDWLASASEAAERTRFPGDAQGRLWSAFREEMGKAMAVFWGANDADAAFLGRFQSSHLRLAAPVAVDGGVRPKDAILLLRGLTQEFHRPLRAALARLAEEEGGRAALREVAERAVARLDVPMREIQPPELEKRLEQDLSGLFAILLPWTDRARRLPELCDDLCALPKTGRAADTVGRVAGTFLAWDRALCAGGTSRF